MSHLEPDQLAMLAMGDAAPTETVSEHLESCAECKSELRELSHVVQVGRATIDIGELETPPAAVWERIAAEVALQKAPPTTEPAHPVRRPLRTMWMLAASAALVAAAGLGTWAAVQWSEPTTIAEAALEPFPEHANAVGTAVVEQERGGQDLVRVTLSAERDQNTFREVWLITQDASALVSLGVLDGDEATFRVPSGVDLRDYVLVDISQEPVDGDPNHSGDSIVRGELSFTQSSAASAEK